MRSQFGHRIRGASGDRGVRRAKDSVPAAIADPHAEQPLGGCWRGLPRGPAGNDRIDED